MQERLIEIERGGERETARDINRYIYREIDTMQEKSIEWEREKKERVGECKINHHRMLETEIEKERGNPSFKVVQDNNLLLLFLWAIDKDIFIIHLNHTYISFCKSLFSTFNQLLCHCPGGRRCTWHVAFTVVRLRLSLRFDGVGSQGLLCNAHFLGRAHNYNCILFLFLFILIFFKFFLLHFIWVFFLLRIPGAVAQLRAPTASGSRVETAVHVQLCCQSDHIRIIFIYIFAWST